MGKVTSFSERAIRLAEIIKGIRYENGELVPEDRLKGPNKYNFFKPIIENPNGAWICGIKELTKRIDKWLSEDATTEYSDDLILKSIKKYEEDINKGVYTSNGIVYANLLVYFIFKNKSNGEYESKLSRYIEYFLERQ